ncbi:MAG: trypsin-like peptidase domain-containing protein [Formosimonas sp.]
MFRAMRSVLVFVAGCSVVSLVQAAPDVAQILRTSAPSIVTVQAVQWVKVKIPEQYKNVTQDPVYQVFSRIFSDADSPAPAANAAPVIRKKAAGNGFIIAPNGVIVTNYHTVVGANEIYVQLSDKRRLKATLMRSEPKRDLAILKVAAGSLPALPLADTVNEGDWVIAVGANKAGASSGTVYNTPSANSTQGLVTDVDISAANSGGPLLDTDGEALAMNSNLLKAATGLTRHVLVSKLVNSSDLKATLPQSWQKLGFTAINLTEAAQQKYGLPDATGALVQSVQNASVAHKAGLQTGDVIVALESQRVVDVADLSALRDFLTQDDEVNLTVIRAGDRKVVRFVLAKTANAFDQANFYSWQQLGLKVRALTNAQKSTLGVTYGLQITAVQKGAANAGLNAGDFILSINQQELKSVEQLNSVAKKLESGDTAFIYIAQGAVRQFVGIDVE